MPQKPEVTWLNHRNPRITQLVKAQKSYNDKSEEFYLLVNNTGGDVYLEDSDLGETVRIYRRGACVPFAYAVALITSLPIAVFTDPTSGAYWSGHATVQLPNGSFFDIEGENSKSSILNFYHFPMSVEPSIFATPEEAHYSMGEHSEELGEDGILSYMFKHVNELGFLVTLHFAEQVLSFYGVPFDEVRLHSLEAQVTAYAHQQKREAKRAA